MSMITNLYVCANKLIVRVNYSNGKEISKTFSSQEEMKAFARPYAVELQKRKAAAFEALKEVKLAQLKYNFSKHPRDLEKLEKAEAALRELTPQKPTPPITHSGGYSENTYHGVTFGNPKGEVKREEKAKQTPLQEALELTRLTGTTAEKVQQLQTLFAPKDWQDLYESGDPLKMQTRAVSEEQLFELVNQLCQSPEAFVRWVREHFGHMGAMIHDGKISLGNLLEVGGYAPSKDPEGKVKFEKVSDSDIGLKAADSLAAVILFIQLLGIVSSARYAEAEGEFGKMPKMFSVCEGGLVEIEPKAEVFIKAKPAFANSPLAPIGPKANFRYEQITQMIKSRAGWYNAALVDEYEHLDMWEDLADEVDAMLDRLSTNFSAKVRESLGRKYPGMKITAKWVAAAGIRLIDGFIDYAQVAQALDAYVMATLNPHMKYATTSAGWQVLKGVFLNESVSDLYTLQGLTPETVVKYGTAEVPENLVFCDPVVYPMDYAMSYNECVFYLELISNHCSKSYGVDKIKVRFELTHNDDNVIFGLDDYKFVINPDNEVYEADRELYVRNQLFVNPLLTNRKAKEEDIALVNPYGALIYGICNNLNLACSREGDRKLKYYSGSPRWGELYKALIAGETLSIDAEEESGGSTTGDRGLWNHYVTKPFVWNGGLCWDWVHHCPRFGKVQKFASGSLDCLTTAARQKYNLAHLPKGSTPFIDGRLAWLHLPTRGLEKQLRLRFARLVLTTLTGESDTYKALCSVFPEIPHLYESKEKAIAYGLHNFLVALSVKHGKILKRIGHKFAKHAEPLGPNARDMALIMFGWNQASRVHSVRGAWSPKAITSAGQSWKVQGGFDPALLKSSYTCEKKFTASYTLKVEDAVENSVGGVTSWTFKHQVVEGGAVDKPWSVNGVEVKKGDVILELTYTSVDGTTSTQLVKAPQDCILQEITLERTMWGQTKVKLRYSMVQSNGKLRGNQKTTVVFTGKSVIYNTMNDLYSPGIDSKVELIITGDADKSPDLAMGIMEVVAETLRETKEGRAKLRMLNAPLGIDSEEHLYWSYHLAVLGLYDDILQEFHAEFLRPVWFQTTDVPNNYVRGVREIYLNKAGTETKPGKAGWYVVTREELEAYLGKGTSFPENAEDFHVITNGLHDVAQIKWTKGVAEIQSGEILVFYTHEGVDYMWQRTPVFIGSDEVGVRIPCKFEISTVDQAAGNTTRLMNTVYRVIASGLKNGEGEYILAPQPKLAGDLAADTVDSIDRWAAFQAMAKGLDLKIVAPEGGLKGSGKDLVRPAKLVNMFGKRTEPGKPETFGFTPEFQQLVSTRLSDKERAKAKVGKLSLRRLAEIFWDITFVFSIPKGDVMQNIHIYLPALVSQDAEPATTESISGLVKHTFELGITNTIVTPRDGMSLSVRLNAALRCMLESRKGVKKTNQGRKSAQCKAQALPGIPTEELWVLHTSDDTPYSVYNNLREVFRLIGYTGDLTGMIVLCTRSPIPFPAVLKIVIKHKPSAEKVTMAEQVLAGDVTVVGMTVAEAQEVIACNSLQPSQAGFSPLAAQVSGGDNDGDGYSFTPILELLELLTYSMVDKVITARTGVGMTAKEQSGYLADHCWVKKWALADIENPRLVTKNNIRAFKRPDFSKEDLAKMGVSNDDPLVNVRSFDGYDRNAECAIQTFSPNVGVVHGMATRAEAASGLIKALALCGYTGSSSFRKYGLEYLAKDCSDIEETIFRVIIADHLISLGDCKLDPEINTWIHGEVALPMYEYYEGNPLGGLSYYGYCMTEKLKQLMYKSPMQEVSDLEWEDTVKEAGMNPAFDFQSVAAWCRKGYKFKGAPDTHDVNTFLVVASELVHLIGRGEFQPLYIRVSEERFEANRHLMMARYFLKWDAGTGDAAKVSKRLCAKSPIFTFLYHFVRTTTRLFGKAKSPVLVLTTSLGVNLS